MKQFFKYVLKEAVNYGIGWAVGLLSVQLVLLFFEEKSFTNLWGLWSNKMVVEKSTLTLLEWLTSAVIGFVVMMQVNKLVNKVSSTYLVKK